METVGVITSNQIVALFLAFCIDIALFYFIFCLVRKIYCRRCIAKLPVLLRTMNDMPTTEQLSKYFGFTEKEYKLYAPFLFDALKTYNKELHVEVDDE